MVRPFLCLSYVVGVLGLSACEPDPIAVDLVFALDPTSCGTCSGSQLVFPQSEGVVILGVGEVVPESQSPNELWSSCLVTSEQEDFGQVASRFQNAFVEDGLAELSPGDYRIGLRYVPPGEFDDLCPDLEDIDREGGAQITGNVEVTLGQHDNPIRIVLSCDGLVCPGT